MKAIHYILGIIFTLSLILVLLITSVEAVAYWTPGYYEKEYTKYGVTEDVQMEMDDLLVVTDKMMDYLRGDREELQVITKVNGAERPFFSQREIAHMEDVKGLFLGGLALRRICIGIAIAALILLYFLKGKMRHILPRAIAVGTGGFFAIVCILAGLFATDFTRYFTIFHEIFFDNDLWLLNPRVDLLINIVPEPFFVDTAARIALIFGLCILVLLAGSAVVWRKEKKTSV